MEGTKREEMIGGRGGGGDREGNGRRGGERRGEGKDGGRGGEKWKVLEGRKSCLPVQ